VETWNGNGGRVNVGVLGGTFDPVHNGHLAIAQEAVIRLSMAKIIFVPAGQPWLKADKTISDAEHRANMVRLAIAGTPQYEFSGVEIEREGPSYAVDTIAQLRAQLPHNDSLYFIMGWDSLSQLPRWREPERLIAMCYLVAAPRLGCPPPDMASLEKDIPGINPRVILMKHPEVAVSASEIRERVGRGMSITEMVPIAVNEYIAQKKLYLT